MMCTSAILLLTVNNLLSIILFLTIFSIATCAPVIERICIVGGGTAGLGLAASLKQIDGTKVKEIEVYEARNDFRQAQLGGGVQLSGGAAVMEKINCLQPLRESAQVLKGVVSRDYSGRKLLELDIEEAVRATAREQLCANGGSGDPMVYTVMREKLISILYDATQKTKSAKTPSPKVSVKSGKKFLSIEEDASSGLMTVNFEDGSSVGNFDMVVGADGIASKVRDFTGYGAKLLIPNPLDGGRTEGGSFTGIRITYCVTPPEKELKGGDLLRKGMRDTFNQWFGDGAYILAGSYGGSGGAQHMLAVVYGADRDSIYGDNPDWNAGSDAKNLIRSRMQQAGLGSNTELVSVLDAASQKGGRFFDLGVRDTSVPLKKWSSDSGGVLLIGDSAHAMAPFLGQGANQAIQDGYCLASLIKSANNRGCTDKRGKISERIKIVQGFEGRRKPPTAALAAKSNILGRIETLGSPVGVLAKSTFFTVMGGLGVAKREFINGALPRL